MRVGTGGYTFVIAAIAVLASQAAAIQSDPQCHWQAVSGGVNSTALAMATFDDGSGPALYVGGFFTTAGGVGAGRIARWDGKAWTQPFSIWGQYVSKMTSFDDGRGRALFIAGDQGAVTRWDGNELRVLDGLSGWIGAMCVVDRGNSQGLYVAGGLALGDGPEKIQVAKWDGDTWTPVGNEFSGGTVDSLVAYDDGTGLTLYAGGSFEAVGGTSINRIAKWDGVTWAPLAGGVLTSGTVSAMAAFDDGSGLKLYAGGSFLVSSPGVSDRYLARWDGSAWSGLQWNSNEIVHSLAELDAGFGVGLYAGSGWQDGLRRWNGTSWNGIGSTGGQVFAMASFDDGDGPAIYVGGNLSSAGGVAVNCCVAAVHCGFDCNDNGVLDHVEVVSGEAADCNGNRVPDACDLTVVFEPGEHHPFAADSPLSAVLEAPAPAAEPVEVVIRVRALLSGLSRFLTLRINDAVVATLFLSDGEACPFTPQTRTITLSAEQFNQFVAAGSIAVQLVPSGAVGACADSFADIRVSYLSLPDCDGDGVWDACQMYEDLFSDCNRNAVLDACEKYSPTPIDCNGDGTPDECEIAYSPWLDANGDGILDACSYARGDFNLDGVVDGSDLGVILALWGLKNPEIGDLNGDGVIDGADLGILLSNWGPVKW